MLPVVKLMRACFGVIKADGASLRRIILRHIK